MPKVPPGYELVTERSFTRHGDAAKEPFWLLRSTATGSVVLMDSGGAFRPGLEDWAQQLARQVAPKSISRQ